MNRLQRLGALAGLLGVLSLTACTGEGEPPEPAPSSQSSDPSVSSSSSESAEPSDEPSEPAAVDGPTLSGDIASFQVPRGYKLSEFGFGVYNADKGDARISLLEVLDVGDLTLEQLVGTLNAFKGKPQVSYDVDLGGQPAFMAEGPGKGGRFVRQYGAAISGHTATISFLFAEGLSPSERDELAEAVLATWTWL